MKIAGKQRTCEALVDDGFNALQSAVRSFNDRHPAAAGADGSHTVACQYFDPTMFIRAMVSVRFLSLAAIHGWVSATKVVKSRNISLFVSLSYSKRLPFRIIEMDEYVQLTIATENGGVVHATM